MAKADNALQEYWDDEEKFADLFNAKLFGGEKVILPEKLSELDSRGTMKISGKGKKESVSTSVYRDLVKVTKIYKEYGIELVILGLENQEHIHYEVLNISERIKPFVNDYGIHLVEVRENDLPLRNENNQDLFKLCSIVLDTKKPDEQKKKEAIQYEREHRINEEVLYALADITNYDLCEEKRGAMNMCTFFDHLVEQGIEQGVICQTLKKIAKNLSPEQTADMLEADINTIRQIYNIKAANPEYNEKEIYEAMQVGKSN